GREDRDFFKIGQATRNAGVVFHAADDGVAAGLVVVQITQIRDVPGFMKRAQVDLAADHISDRPFQEGYTGIQEQDRIAGLQVYRLLKELEAAIERLMVAGELKDG